MAKQEISELLSSLRQAIADLEGGQPEAKSKLEALVGKIEPYLEEAEAKSHPHLVDDVKEAVSQFEMDHPTLTGVLNELMVALGNMGI